MRSLLRIGSLMKYIVISLVVSSCASTRLGESLGGLVVPDTFLQTHPIIWGNANLGLDTCNSFRTKEWPVSLPMSLCYPQATLIESKLLKQENISKYWDNLFANDQIAQLFSNNDQPFQIVWRTSASVEQLQQFYQNFFEASGWDIVRQSSTIGTINLRGIKNGNQILIRFDVEPPSDRENNGNTDIQDTSRNSFSRLIQVDQTADMEGIYYLLLYGNYGASAEVEPSNNLDVNSDHSQLNSENLSRNIESETLSQESYTGQQKLPLDNDYSPSGSVDSRFAEIDDLDETPDVLKAYVKDFITLGIVQLPVSTVQPIENGRAMHFAPNDEITRCEYANWLFRANNLFYSDRPSKMLRLASTNSLPVFQDILPDNPDFGVIQGLAEAGLIPSILTDESTSILFNPSGALTRKDLIAWKAPLDNQKVLPQVTVDEVEQLWGFIDVEQLDRFTLASLAMDYKNGDKSTIRRVFGYTRLFQPEKIVTRAEAAAALWYFGSQTTGHSASDLVKATTDSQNTND